MKMYFIIKYVIILLMILLNSGEIELKKTFKKKNCVHETAKINNSSEFLNLVDFSDCIFTGKVKHLVGSTDISFVTQNKRFFKGLSFVECFNVSLKVSENDCAVKVRVNDSAIFFGKYLHGKRFPNENELCNHYIQLLTYPLHLSVHNLNKISSALKDKNNQPQPLLIKDPCSKTYCAWGAECVSRPGGRAHCRCPVWCALPESVAGAADPRVCGTDGVTYDSRCHLRQTSCRARSNTRVQYAGSCPNITTTTDQPDYNEDFVTNLTTIETTTELSDPCRGKTCGFGAKCVASADGRSASCICPSSCPNYGDHSASRPVCGSNGKDYKDRCALHKHACETNTNITVKFEGSCDPCADVVCPEPEVCQLEGVQRKPVCRCGEICSLEFTPVCGSDGKTYSNECALRQEACRTRRSLRIIYRKKCSAGVNPCSSVRCALWEECTINKYGIARCECPSDCEPVMRPVCSKDGRTFSSECELKRATCNTRTNIEVAYLGVCDKTGPCSEHQCQWGAQCVEQGGLAQCECPTCSIEYQPICGSDGITYSNDCKLRQEACSHKRDIRVLYDGPCNGCENKKCDFYSICESDGLSEAQCVCSQSCDNKEFSPVCGTDGVTYDSECHLQAASCQTKQYVIIAYKGHCDLCKDIECKNGAYCKAGECICPTDCSNSGIEPVCASNMKTYTNECEMKKASCEQNPDAQQALNVIFYGDCRERFAVMPDPIALRMEVKPCNGEKPLVDPSTEVELDCGSGINRQDCPSDSYCHQTTRFARCCPKNQKIYPKSCEDSWYGCCPDRKTPAQGPEHAGCPSQCGCHRLGSFDDTCDPETGQCHCRPGVGGIKCDRCEPGYWGLPKISSGHHGCLPCGCSTFGSVRDDCEQMTGRCVCKPEIQGQKCTICTSHDKVLSPNGCVAVDRTTPPPSSCKELNCHFGAMCTDRRGLAICECHSDCGNETPGSQQIVCGSDGQTYESECQLRLVACRHQKDIVVYAFGACKGSDWPIPRYTPMQYTQPDETHASLSKSTRHLLVPDSRYYYSRQPVNVASKNNTWYKETNQITGINFNPQAAFRPTPATVRVLTALLGDLCSDNSDCIIKNSICVGGACTCKSNFVETLDRQECLAHFIPMTTTEEVRACISSPCFGDSTCIDLPSATFTCVCGTNFTGRYCDNELNIISYQIPSFDGTSYIKMKRIKAYHKLNIEIELKSYKDNGIVFYNHQKPDGTGDFISLAIVNGYIEFRYNLGNGVVKLVSLKKIDKSKYHHIVLKRYHRDGMLKLDDGEDVAGHSQGKLRALDLKDDAYIGSVPLNITRIFENIGTRQGFSGCIRKLKINHKLIELHPGGDDNILNIHRIQECGNNPCTSTPCLNGATCHSHDPESYHCICNEGFTGALCEVSLDQCVSNPCKYGSTCEASLNGKYYCKCLPGYKGKNCDEMTSESDIMSIPEFNGTAYLEYPKLEGVRKEFSIEVWILAYAANGLILYTGQHKKGIGDYLSLNLVNKHVQFRFNLGSGICNITSKETISLFKWHQIKINRYKREGTLQVDNGTIVKGLAGAALTDLNVELPFYIGSVPVWSQIHRLSGASKGFRGAIQRIIVNGNELSIKQAKKCSLEYINMQQKCKSHHLNYYDGPPCPSSKNPCKEKETCIPLLNSYICKCLNNNCKTNDNPKKAIKFDGNTYFHYKNKRFRRKIEKGNSFEVQFRTFDTNGLLLWRSKNRSHYKHYLAIIINNGYIEFSFNLGKQSEYWSVRYPKQINDGAWHTVFVRRHKRIGHITVDGSVAEKRASISGAIVFNGSPKIWLGGSPELPTGLPTVYYSGFRGCIQYVKVNNKHLDIWKDRSSVLQYCHENEV